MTQKRIASEKNVIESFLIRHLKLLKINGLIKNGKIWQQKEIKRLAVENIRYPWIILEPIKNLKRWGVGSCTWEKPCDGSLVGMSKEDGAGLEQRQWGEGGARSQRPCFRSLDFILRTSRHSSKGFEQGNNDQICVWRDHWRRLAGKVQLWGN